MGPYGPILQMVVCEVVVEHSYDNCQFLKNFQFERQREKTNNLDSDQV